MKGKLVTYNTKGKVENIEEVIGFITEEYDTKTEKETIIFYIALPVKNSKKGYNQNVIVSLDELFDEIKRRVNRGNVRGNC